MFFFIFFLCFTFERGREGDGCKKKKRQCWVDFFKTKVGFRGLFSSSLGLPVSFFLFLLEGEPEAVADGDPDDLEDALAGHELDEQDAEEAHLVFLLRLIFFGGGGGGGGRERASERARRRKKAERSGVELKTRELTIAALELILSALSTKPYLAVTSLGSTGGWVTFCRVVCVTVSGGEEETCV